VRAEFSVGLFDTLEMELNKIWGRRQWITRQIKERCCVKYYIILPSTIMGRPRKQKPVQEKAPCEGKCCT
jgi:hypothetical protein